MATKKTRPAADPAQAANDRVLADRQQRIDHKMKEVVDLGLDLRSNATDAAEFIRDEFDKRAFGDDPKTVTRWVYGPDPLLDSCPAFKRRLEELGREEFAEAFGQAILRFEHRAVPDPVMQKGLLKALQKFGKEQVADAFRDRILKIPARQVEYELDTGEFGDPLLLGSNSLRDCVMRYGNEPGMAYKFLSARCIDVLGMRGYELVKMANGDPAKAGTLFLAKIPEHVAERRRRKFAAESEAEVRAQEERYMDTAERFVRAAGRVGEGSRPLKPGEVIAPNAAESEGALNNDYEMGVRIERA